jgi:hypothetical protein
MGPRLVLLALALAGCDDPLKPTELVEEPRVLAARVEVDGAPERAAPYPGERARVRFLVAAPELEPPLGYALVACRAAPSNVGLAACAEPVFAERALLDPEPVAPELEFELPQPAAADETPRLLVKGVICPHGSPRVTESPTTCVSGADALPVTLELDLATELEANLNPSFAEAELLLDGEPFPAPAVALDTDCAGLGLVEVPAASAHRFVVGFPESARDPLLQSSDFATARESLLLSHFVSAGELDRAFSPIPAASAEIRAEVDWVAPDAGALGRLVRFWFVIRDLRGGSDFAERALCVVP